MQMTLEQIENRIWEMQCYYNVKIVETTGIEQAMYIGKNEALHNLWIDIHTNRELSEHYKKSLKEVNIE